MKYYLSSYKFGNEVEKLKQMLPKGAKIGHINNAKDWTTASPEIRARILKEEIEFMDSLGFQNEHLDLKKYFGKEQELRNKLDKLDGIWICGGMVNPLMQAMIISGFNNIFPDLQKRKDFLWGGYSAGVVVLCDSLKYYDLVDMPNDFPYEQISEPIYEGLGLFNYGILPHYDSDHHESELIGKEVQRAIENRWLFKVMRDGEVIIMED